jgi:hypothetical protein
MGVLLDNRALASRRLLGMQVNILLARCLNNHLLIIVAVISIPA